MFMRFLDVTKRFIWSTSGAVSIDYVVLAAAIAATGVGLGSVMGSGMEGAGTTLGNGLNSVVDSATSGSE
ncbi:MAG: hypothetical protein AAFQ36_13480 [Pseudomonadota bacterium]